MKNGTEWLTRAHGAAQAPHIVQAYRAVFGLPEASTVLKDLSLYCQLGQSSFIAGDPYHTAFNEGARDVLLHILEVTGMEPETLLMKKEDRS